MDETTDDTSQVTDDGAQVTDETTQEAHDGQAEPVETGELEESAGRKPIAKRLLITAGVVAFLLLAAGQVLLITSLRTTQDQIESLDDQVTDLGGSVYDMSQTVDDIADDARAAAANSAASGATPAPAVPAGFLPRFTTEGPDQALGMALTTVEGPDAYTESPLTIDPADGTKRVWMVWAHWCPYCQQELPELNAWWPEAQANYPNAELVTVTTSMDPARGNPLEPYLEESQFVFPVVVDNDTKIAAQMGVNAFPFWLVTDSDGTVLFRTAGALQIDQVEQLFNQLEEIDG